MVRNPRMVMLCGLLAAATGIALGSRIGPVATPEPGLALFSIAPGLAGLRAWWPRTAQPTPPSVASRSIADGPSLEGDRQPRGPRRSHDQLDRTSR